MDESWQVLVAWWNDLPFLGLALALAFPVAVFFLRKWLGNFCVSGIALLIGRFGVSIDQSRRQELVRASGNLLVLFAVFLSIQSLGLPLEFSETALLIVKSLLVCGVFWLINALVQALLSQSGALGVQDERFIASWLSQIIGFFLIIVMGFVVLSIWGINLGSTLTGIGIVGAAAALAAQDFIRNIVAGFSLAAEGRFSEGDWIRVSPELEGIVEDVKLFSTVIRRFDNAKVHVPNAELAYKSLPNFSRRPTRRLKWIVPLKLGTDPDALNGICEKIAEYISSNELFLSGDDFGPTVCLYAFAEYSIEMMVNSYTATNVYADELAARHQLILATKSILEQHGVEFALPSRAIYFDGEQLEEILSRERDVPKP